jgi:hypothetical protein
MAFVLSVVGVVPVDSKTTVVTQQSRGDLLAQSSNMLIEIRFAYVRS